MLHLQQTGRTFRLVNNAVDELDLEERRVLKARFKRIKQRVDCGGRDLQAEADAHSQ